MADSLLDCIGNGPLFRLQRLAPSWAGELWVKWERSNPGGSIKDRPARHIVEFAERRGLLRPGGTIVESSSGNFGISLAMIGAARGYRVIILIDPKTTAANRKVLSAFGAETIVVTEQDDSGSYHKTRIALANKLAREIPGAFRPDQCFNLLNSEAHYLGTANEILQATEGKLDVLVAAVSTGGQLGGLSRYMRDHAPHVRVVGADAEGSAIFGGTSAPYLTPGVGLGWTPSNLDLDLLHAAFKVPDADIFAMCRALARFEGVLAGASSGASLLVALREALNLTRHTRVVAVLADGGDRYLDNVYDEEWLAERGIEALEPSLYDVRLRARGLSPVPDLRGTPAGDVAEELGVPRSTLACNLELTNMRTRGQAVSVDGSTL